MLLVVVASIAAGVLVFFELVLGRQPLLWDEATHALLGALIAQDLRSGDLLALLFDTYRQVYWPPLHSWLIGIPFLVTGPLIEVARGVSVAAYVLLAPTLYLVARTVEPRRAVLAGSLAAGLALTSPGIVALAARSMLELPAALAFGCTMLIYCRLKRTPETRPVKHALLGVWIVLTYLVKTNYGVLLAICVVLTELLEARFKLRPLLSRRNLYTALPVAVFCAIWFAWPPKIASTWDALVNQPYGGEQARGLTGLLFYPRSIVELGGPASALLFAGVVLSWKHRRESGIGFLLVLALTHFVIGEFHHTKLDRHIVPMLPPMFVLTGVAAARLWEWLRTHGGANRNLAAALVASLAVLQVASMGLRDRTTPVVQVLSPALVRNGTEVLDYVSAQADEQTSTLVLHTNRAWPYPSVLDWHLVSEGLLPVTAAGEAMDPHKDNLLAAMIERKSIPEGLEARSLRVLRRYNEPSKMRSLHSTEWQLEDLEDYAAFVDATIRSDPPNAIIAFVGRSDSTNQTVDLVERGIVENGYRRVSVREFRAVAGAVSRIYVYRRP